MTGTVTVLTPTVNTRPAELVEAVASVAAQTRRAHQHLVAFDAERVGGPRMLNDLAHQVSTDYVMVLPDDDLLLPQHIERLAAVLDERPEVDVVSSWCDTIGRDFTLYNVDELDRGMVQRRSCVAHTALFRSTLLYPAGWPDEPGYDWLFWKALAGQGATFAVVPEVTFTYRLEGGNESQGETP